MAKGTYLVSKKPLPFYERGYKKLQPAIFKLDDLKLAYQRTGDEVAFYDE